MKVKFISADITQPMRFEEVRNAGLLFKELADLIGAKYVESVRLGRYPGNIHLPSGETQYVPNDGKLLMIVDDEGLHNKKPLNTRAGMLYGSQYHGQLIVGDAVLVSEIWTEDGPDWGPYALED